MGRIIKGSGNDGDITPETGFTDAAQNRGGKVLKSDRYEARHDAQNIREQAQSRADHILAAAENEAERIKEAAYEEAKAQGYEEGKVAGAAELTEVIARTAAKMQRIEAQAIPQLKDLAVKIARKILGRELEFHPEAVVDIVKQALSEKARQRREIFLRVNPADMAHIRSAKPELIEVLSRCKEIGLREDPDVARYGCVIETDAGIIDAQLETQMEVFERVLKDLG